MSSRRLDLMSGVAVGLMLTVGIGQAGAQAAGLVLRSSTRRPVWKRPLGSTRTRTRLRRSARPRLSSFCSKILTRNSGKPSGTKVGNCVLLDCSGSFQ